ncbi:MAG: tetratricopeptide repeat protein, partial [Alphaproteobacteria bacterium]|nr:tetratricopeptide repeat protein [Alphaproteobacteria bacterium]
NDLDEAIRLDPKNALIWSNRGFIKSKLGKHQEAIKDLDKAIRLNPDDQNTRAGRVISELALQTQQKIENQLNKLSESAKENFEKQVGQFSDTKELEKLERYYRQRKNKYQKFIIWGFILFSISLIALVAVFFLPQIFCDWNPEWSTACKAPIASGTAQIINLLPKVTFISIVLALGTWGLGFLIQQHNKAEIMEQEAIHQILLEARIAFYFAKADDLVGRRIKEEYINTTLENSLATKLMIMSKVKFTPPLIESIRGFFKKTPTNPTPNAGPSATSHDETERH